jgi:hypothetical protein
MDKAVALAYRYVTAKGEVFLWPQQSGRYAIVFEGDNLGSYHSARSAASDAYAGVTFSTASGIDLGDLDIPEDLSEWEKRPVTAKELMP